MATRGGDEASNAAISVDRLLAEARVRLDRLSLREAQALVRNGEALLIDIRTDRQRAADGRIPDATFVARNVLEWRSIPAALTAIRLCHGGTRS
jgi:rhodanese-related sulfurtransferase